MKEKDISNFLIATLFMAVCVLWPKKTAQDDGRETQDDTERNTYQRDERHNEAEPNEHEAIEQRYWRRQNQLGCVTVVINFLILVAAVLAFSAAWNAYVIGTDALGEARNQTEQARRQAKAAENQIAVAADTEKRQLRAYVFVNEAFVKIDQNGKIDAAVTIKNFGQTPAYEVTHWACVVLREWPLNANDPLTQPELLRNTTIPKTSMGPTDSRRKFPPFCDLPNITDRALTQSEQNEITNGMKALYVYGEIKYFDTFKYPHWTIYRLYRHRTIGSDGTVVEHTEGNNSN